MRKWLLVVIITLVLLIFSRAEFRLYALDAQLSCVTEDSSQNSDLWYPPYPQTWNKVGIIISASTESYPFADSLGRKLWATLKEVFQEVRYLGASAVIGCHDERLDAVFTVCVDECTVQGWMGKRSFSARVSVDALETMSSSETNHKFSWTGEIEGSVAGFLPKRMLLEKLAMEPAASVCTDIRLHISKRCCKDAVATSSYADEDMSSWFQPIKRDRYPRATPIDPLLPSDVCILSYFEQKDLYGTTISARFSYEASTEDIMSKLRECIRSEIGVSASEFVSDEKDGGYELQVYQDTHSYYFMVMQSMTKLVIKKPGELVEMSHQVERFVQGEKSLEALRNDIEMFYNEKPLAASRLLLANCLLEQLLINWSTLSVADQPYEVDQVERVFRRCRHPLDGALHAYVLGRLYYKLGISCDKSYFLQSEEAFNTAMEYDRGSEYYPYALFGKALVLSSPAYLGHDYEEAVRIFNTLHSSTVLKNEAAMQLQRVLLLNEQNSTEAHKQEDNFLKSYVAMLQGDWNEVERLLLTMPTESYRDEVIRRLQYDSLRRQTGRPVVAAQAILEGSESYFNYLSNFLREKYSGIFQ